MIEDGIQRRLVEYSRALTHEAMSPEARHAATVRVIDTLGALIGGFSGEPCRIARSFASRRRVADGVSIIGTRMKTSPDIAAYVNGTTARYPELIDSYHGAGSTHGHPSDVVVAILGIGELERVSGMALIDAVVLAYEIFARIADIGDIFLDHGFDYTNLVCLGVAVGAGRIMKLSTSQLSECIALAVVPSVILGQVRTGHLSMFKAIASGHAASAGVFAALQARAGMSGPACPFEGEAGWCRNIMHKRFGLEEMGGDGIPFRIVDTVIKMRPCAGGTISSVLAAEKIAPLQNVEDVKLIRVDVYKKALELSGTGLHHWHPSSRETADRSLAYIVATTLLDGSIGLQSFDDEHLRNPRLRRLMQKIQIFEDIEFTRAYGGSPQEHRSRITIVGNNGEQLISESGGGDDINKFQNDDEIEEKFRTLTEPGLGSKRVDGILGKLWQLEALEDVSVIPPLFRLE